MDDWQAANSAQRDAIVWEYFEMSEWDVSQVTDMSYLVSEGASVFNGDLSKWDTGQVTTMSGMFSGA